MPLWFATALLPDGWAEDVRIHLEAARASRRSKPKREPAAGDERHAIAIPGLANVHSHAFQRGMAGLGRSARTREATISGPGAR